MSSQVKIRYIGHQPKKRASTVIPTCSVIWDGHGDVQLVDINVAEQLLKPLYSEIWQLVKDKPAAAGASLAAASTAPVVEGTGIPGLDGPAPTDPPAETEEEQAARIQKEADDAEAEKVADENAARARIEELLGSFVKLKKNQDFDAQGKPKLVALNKLLNRTVTANERDIAWKLALEKLPKKAGKTDTTEQAPE